MVKIHDFEGKALLLREKKKQGEYSGRTKQVREQTDAEKHEQVNE